MQYNTSKQPIYDSFPHVTAWCECLHDRGGQVNAQRRVRFDAATRELVGVPLGGGGGGGGNGGDGGDGGGGGGSTYAHEGIGCWPDDDEVPETVMRMVACFYEEMWPVLVSSCDRYALYLKRFTTSYSIVNSQ